MKKILIIEDDDNIRENISDALAIYNYKIYSAVNGEEGVHFAKVMNPDLILCDIRLPLLDGYSVLETIKKNEMTSHIPFIFISAKSSEEDVQKGMNLGADEYLIKPFLLKDLIKKMEDKLIKID